MSDPQALSGEELDAQHASELPVREAMSLIATDPSALIAAYGDTGGLGLPDLSDAGAGGTTTDADQITHINQTDTSTAGAS